ncbi:(2,3-dihydroxybenzoyl)adenylate synthase [Actinomadura rayongensis]|uniref:AMP-binding protein n=1 Tax=Actinomadura rayongensis TaxID=1429076 RepID=A0A6I4WHH5_9ACTN|nr:AMP-binding protein [Actinomadura rayongensis]MXQ68310.1 AMP-binding protein [Actinomadura rayongensis]
MDGFTPWPPEFAARYEAAGYWGRDLLGDVPRGAPDRTALVAGDVRLTYADLDLRVRRAADGFTRLGLRRGDRVIVQLPNTAGFAVVFLALVRSGIVPVLALPAHRADEVGALRELTDARAYVVGEAEADFDVRRLARSLPVDHVVVDGDAGEFTALADVEAAGRADAVPERPEPGDVAVLLLSGGTTGSPKLIPRTHRDYVYNVRASADVCGFGPDTVYLAAIPAAHNFALACPGILGALHRGGTVVMAPTTSPAATFPLIERERVTVSALVPPAALLWARAAARTRHDLASLRLLQVGGARLAPEHAATVPRALGCALQQVFGMAEGLLNFTRPDDPPHLVERTQGRPLSPADEISVVGPDGAPVPPGAVGELLTRGPYTLRGYYRAPEHNARAFTRDGFFRTGDLVRRLPSGHLVVEGRTKEQINRGGEKFAAAELEGHLLAHPAVRDAAVVGLPDPVLGERTCAFVVLRDGAPPLPLAAVKEFLRGRGVAAFKFPDRVETVAAFPLTGVGKVDKNALAAR